MPMQTFARLLIGVIACSGLTLALAHWVGALAVVAPVALVLAWLVRRVT